MTCSRCSLGDLLARESLATATLRERSSEADRAMPQDRAELADVIVDTAATSPRDTLLLAVMRFR